MRSVAGFAVVTAEPDDDMMSPEESHALLLDMVASIAVHRDLLEDILTVLASDPDIKPGLADLREQSRETARGLRDGTLNPDPDFPAERYWAERNAILEAAMGCAGDPSPTSTVVRLDEYRRASTVH